MLRLTPSLVFCSSKALKKKKNCFVYNVLLWNWASWSTVGSSEFLVKWNNTGKPKAILQQKIPLWTLSKKSLTQGLANPNILQKHLGRKSSSISVLGDRSCWSLWNFCKHSSVCLRNIYLFLHNCFLNYKRKKKAAYHYWRKWCFSISYYSPKELGTGTPALKVKIYTL